MWYDSRDTVDGFDYLQPYVIVLRQPACYEQHNMRTQRGEDEVTEKNNRNIVRTG